jgi:PAS domain S-box-containing protein
VSVEGHASAFLQLALLGEAMAHLQDGAVFVWDEDRNYVAVNDAACKLVGLPRAELLELAVGDLTPDRAAPHFEQVQRERRTVGRSTIHRRDGTTVEIEWVTFHSRVAELPYMVSICWPAPA